MPTSPGKNGYITWRVLISITLPLLIVLGSVGAYVLNAKMGEHTVLPYHPSPEMLRIIQSAEESKRRTEVIESRLIRIEQDIQEIKQIVNEMRDDNLLRRRR